MAVKLRLLSKRKKRTKAGRQFMLPDWLPQDTGSSIMGNHVIYTRYLLLIKLVRQPDFSDTVLITYTEEFRDLRGVDKDRLAYLFQKINPSRIEQMVIVQFSRLRETAAEPRHLARRRQRKISRFLRSEGFSARKLKFPARTF